MATKKVIKKNTDKKDAVDLAAPTKTGMRTGIRFVEMGSEGVKGYAGFVQEAYNAQLFWPSVQPLYSRLRRSMPEIVMIRQAFTSWARNIKPLVELPDKPSDDDKRYQEFIESDFENMDGGFAMWVDTLVNQVPFMGWGWWEAVPSIRDQKWRPPGDDSWRSEADDGLIGLRRLAWRDSSTFFGWDMPEPRRKLKGMKQQDWPNQPVTLPIEKSLHITFGDPNNPEGLSPLEAVWRLERMRYGYEVVMGIGSEHAAGHLSIQKTSEGDLSTKDEQMIAETAKNLLSAQEGNYAYWPFGFDGKVLDVPFQAAGSLLEIIKHYSILVLSVYTMQWIALNTMTSTGAQASQVDSTDTGVFTFNSMMDGFASQYDQQVGKRLFEWNKAEFPNITKRPKIKFSHIDKSIALSDLSNFFRTLDGILPLTDDDYKALRVRSGFLPQNVDNMKAAVEARELDEAMNPTPKAPPAQPGAAGGQPGGPGGPGGKPVQPDNNKINFSQFIGLDEFEIDELRGEYGRPGKVGGSASEPMTPIQEKLSKKYDIKKLKKQYDEATPEQQEDFKKKAKQTFAQYIKKQEGMHYKDFVGRDTIFYSGNEANRRVAFYGWRTTVEQAIMLGIKIPDKVMKDYLDRGDNYDLAMDELGGKGSGFFGHAGRDETNQVGGSVGRGSDAGGTKSAAASGVIKIGELSEKDYEELKKGLLFDDPYAVKYMQEHGLTREDVLAQMDKAREDSKNVVSSQARNSVDGKYTKERSELHQKIVDDLTRGKQSQDQPLALITGGLPGAGKSSILETDAYSEFNKNAVPIASDEIKSMLAKADGIEKLGVHAFEYHEESRDVVNLLTNAAVSRKLNMVLDTTMSRTGKTIKMVDAMHKNGYRVEVAFANLPLHKSVHRAAFRFLETGRFVDPYAIAMYDATPGNTFEAVKNSVDKWSYWNTDVPFGQTPILVSSGEN